jgi:hypothetical protein
MATWEEKDGEEQDEGGEKAMGGEEMAGERQREQDEATTGSAVVSELDEAS